MTYYVLCPPNYVTGGVEALHQLSDALRKIGKRAFLVYWPPNENNITPADYHYLPNSYVQGSIIAGGRIEPPPDSPDSTIIIPEIWPVLGDLFPRSRIYIWWLGMCGRGQRKEWHHLAQCYTTKRRLEEQGYENVSILGDYLSPQHFEGEFKPWSERDLRRVLYYPARFNEDTRRMMLATEDRYNWTPISNLTRAGVIDLMRSSRCYVDVGDHPAKDRVPREAVAAGCGIVVMRKGVVNEPEDFPCPSNYIGDTWQQAAEILDRVMNGSGEFIDSEFTAWKIDIADQEYWFMKQVKELFGSED